MNSGFGITSQLSDADSFPAVPARTSRDRSPFFSELDDFEELGTVSRAMRLRIGFLSVPLRNTPVRVFLMLFFSPFSRPYFIVPLFYSASARLKAPLSR